VGALFHSVAASLSFSSEPPKLIVFASGNPTRSRRTKEMLHYDQTGDHWSPLQKRFKTPCRGDLGTPKTRFAHFREPSPVLARQLFIIHYSLKSTCRSRCFFSLVLYLAEVSFRFDPIFEGLDGFGIKLPILRHHSLSVRALLGGR